MRVKYLSDKRILALICLNAGLYVVFLIIDITAAVRSLAAPAGPWAFAADCLKYAGIISCLFICIFALSQERGRVARLQAFVLAFTLAADFLLLFTQFFTAGLLIFLAAHICALIRYRPRFILPACVCAGVVSLIAGLALNLPPPAVIACIYAVLIISVTVSTFFAEQPEINAFFSRLGMCLFIICDINVAIFNSASPGLTVHTASSVLMWAFYLPAQTLLALSATTFRNPRVIQ